MAPIGSRSWSVTTLGKMRLQDRLQFLVQMSALQIRNRLQRLSAARPELSYLDVDEIAIPDTTVARAALDYCDSVSNRCLTNHCLRTYFWGALLAQRDQLHYDEELLFVSAILHDTGLIEHLRQEYSMYDCFAIISGLIASKFAEQHGWQAERCEQVFENISKHLNISVLPRTSIEAHLVQAGAAMDVIGARARQVADAAQQSVLLRYPRLNFKRNFSELVLGEAQAHPKSRMGFLCQRAQFVERIEATPFAE